MKICIPKEIQLHEKRVAATPETVKKFVSQGIEVYVEKGAGISSGIGDDVYAENGAVLAKTEKQLYEGADVILKVQKPQTGTGKEKNETASYPEGSALIAQFNHQFSDQDFKAFSEKKLTIFALERVPRITRAQSMDVLSSQSNLAGYRAVLVGVEALNKAIPMMMTAAGTIMPAKVLVVGAGVAGLQAIATAKRLGAVVSAFDVRPAAKEQVESLGAKFIQVDESESAETAGGYAKEMSADYKKKQAELVEKALKETHLVVTTALIPGRPAPKIITKKMVEGMQLGSVVVDMAAEMGGNCELTKPGESVDHNGVKLIGSLNLPSQLAADASPLFSKNILSFLSLMIESKEQVMFNPFVEDEIVQATCVVKEGDVVASELMSEKAKAPKKAAPKKSPTQKKATTKKPAVQKKTPARAKPSATKKKTKE